MLTPAPPHDMRNGPARFPKGTVSTQGCNGDSASGLLALLLLGLGSRQMGTSVEVHTWETGGRRRE